MNRGPRRYAELTPGAGANTDTNAPPTTYNTATTSAFPNQQAATQNAYQANQTASPFNPSYAEPQYAANSYPQGNGSFSEASSTTSTSGGYNTAKTATTPVSDMKARRKSSKSKQIDTDKIPRPDILPETSYAPPEYVTSSYLNPPASFSNYITIDDGNAGPRYVRSAFYRVPVEDSLVNNTQVPLGLIIQPLADPSPEEEAVPVIDSGEEGPLRCNRCRAYVSPHWLFVKNGTYGVCNLCKMSNEIPKEYYSPLDAAGLRCDRLERPELSKGVYEFLAPQAYHVRPLVTPNILFCIEASSASYLSGVFHQIFSSLQSLLDYIPSPELTKICIVTYDTGVNFFKVPEDLTKEISITHVSDVDSPCLPYPKSYYFLSLQDERDKINYLIERIIKHYESSEKIQKGVFGTCFGAAVVDCCDILLKDGGRVLAFTTQAPIAGLGKIKKREDYKLHGTDKEKTLYVPQVEEYNTWAKRALEKRVCMDLFCFAPEYFDVVTIGNLCGLTGGNFYYYPTYKPTADGERLHYDLARNLTRYVGYDAVMTIRTPQGISFLNYITPSGRKPDAELEFSALDSDTAINAYFKHDEKLTDENVSFQVAVLYSNPYGQRVIRVINFKALTSNDLVAIFRACDVEAVAQLTIKKHISTITSLSVPQIKKALLENLVNILYNYRQHCASGSSPSQLILPEALKVLPMYILSTFKSFVLRTGGEVKSDDRAYDLFRFTKLPLNVLSTYLYPKVYPLHTIWTEDEYAPGNVVGNRVVLPGNVAATDEKIDDNGIYLIDNAEFLFLYIKKGVDPAFLPHLLGVETYQEAAQVTSFPDYIESEYFTKVSSIIDQLRKNKNASYQPVRIVTEKDQSEQAALNCLCEDERLGESYSVFLCNVHKLIHNKYS